MTVSVQTSHYWWVGKMTAIRITIARDWPGGRARRYGESVVDESELADSEAGAATMARGVAAAAKKTTK